MKTRIRSVSLFLCLAVSVAAGCIANDGQNAKSKKVPQAKGAGSSEMRTLFDFTEDGPGSDVSWVAVNDGVMGGVSNGGAKMQDGLMNFSGQLSLENNGGFSSVRTVDCDLDLSAYDELVLRVRGDGRDYQLRFNTNATTWGRSIAYRGVFSTKADQWVTVRIPFVDLEPTFRGRDLEGPPFAADKIRALGVMIADKNAGPFQLQVDWIRAGVGP